MNKLQTAGTLFRLLWCACVFLFFFFSFTKPFRYLRILISLVNRCFLTRLNTSTLHIRIQLWKVGRTWKNKNSALVLLIVSHLWNLYWFDYSASFVTNGSDAIEVSASFLLAHMVVIDFFFFSIYIRCSRLRKFLIKMNSFVTAYTRTVNWWCCGCCHIFFHPI